MQFQMRCNASIEKTKRPDRPFDKNVSDIRALKWDASAGVPVVAWGRRVPAGTDDVQRLTVDVVVQQTRVDTESSHQQNHIAAAEEDVPDLSSNSHY